MKTFTHKLESVIEGLSTDDNGQTVEYTPTPQTNTSHDTLNHQAKVNPESIIQATLYDVLRTLNPFTNARTGQAYDDAPLKYLYNGLLRTNPQAANALVPLLKTYQDFIAECIKLGWQEHVNEKSQSQIIAKVDKAIAREIHKAINNAKPKIDKLRNNNVTVDVVRTFDEFQRMAAKILPTLERLL